MPRLASYYQKLGSMRCRFDLVSERHDLTAPLISDLPVPEL